MAKGKFGGALEATGPVKFASISGTSSIDVVAAIVGSTIRVLSVFLMVTTANGTVQFQSNASTNLTGVMAFGALGQLNLAFSPVGHFQTASGEKLTIALGSSGQVSGSLVYQVLTP